MKGGEDLAKKKHKKKETYVSVYTKDNYTNDEQSFSKSIDSGNIDFESFKRLMIHDICTNTKIIETGRIGRVSLKDAERALQYPEQHWNYLVDISTELMRVSPHYFKLNSLYSNMALFDWWVDLYGVKDSARKDVVKKHYDNLTTKLEDMNLKHEFQKAMKVIPYQDVYCGLILEDGIDYFFQQISLRICKLYQVQDGIFNFRINLSAIDVKNLQAYPDYVQQAYLDFRDGKISQWYVPPADKQICIKLNNQWTYPYPLLIGIVKDVLDLDIYKKLKLQSARTDNYKGIAVKVPIDSSTVDKPLLTPDTLGVFASINRESLSDDIGLIHTLGSDAKEISFKDSSNTRNNVSDAIDEIYNSSGSNKNLFNGSSNATAVTYSVENDAGFVYGVYRQFERWVNRWIKLRKYNKSNFKFKFFLLDITIFNRDTVSKRYRDAISLGVTTIGHYLATLDTTPSRILGSRMLEYDIFDYRSFFSPLQSAYNSSATAIDNQGGRPTNADNGEALSESGEKTADSDANKDR